MLTALRHFLGSDQAAIGTIALPRYRESGQPATCNTKEQLIKNISETFKVYSFNPKKKMPLMKHFS
jgi:hypothetical protein